MRFMVVHPGFDFSVGDVHTGWCEALTQLGHEVVEFNLGKRLDVYTSVHLKKGRRWVRAFGDHEATQIASKAVQSAAFEYWPDVVLIVSAFFIPIFTLKVLKARGMKVVILHTECPYENGRQLERAQYADLNLLNDRVGLEEFEAVAPSYFQPHCYRPSVHHPRPAQEQYRSDFCFVGTGYPSRIEFFEAVDWTGIDAAFCGNWSRLSGDSPIRKFVAHDFGQCLDNSAAVDLYCSSKMSANVYRREADHPDHIQGWSMSPREVELAACGVPFLSQPWGENREVLPFLPTFESAEEFGDQLRHWLARPDELAALGQRAREAVADRTFVAAAERLLTHIAA